MDNKLFNIIIPVCGNGKRFSDKGYSLPKPLIQVNGMSLIEHGINTLGLNGRYIFIVLNYENMSLNREMNRILTSFDPSCTIIRLNSPTKGSAITCLTAKYLINDDNPLLIVNPDHHLKWDKNKFIKFIEDNDPDICVSTYDYEGIVPNQKSPYCFLETDANGLGIRFVEKFAISNHAMNGIHFWKKGKYFIDSLKKMIINNDMVNEELYFSNSFKYLINQGLKILPYKMEKHEYYSLGTPEEIEQNKKYL